MPASPPSTKCLTWFAVWVVNFAPVLCDGHDWPIHQRITESALQSSAALNSFLNANVTSQSLTANAPQPGPTGSRSPSDWLQQGSIFEDEQRYFGMTELRTPDHFYSLSPYRTPGAVLGLYDYRPSLYYLPDNIVNAFVWTTQAGVQGPVYQDLFGITLSLGPNAYQWGDARNYEYAGLTSTFLSDRDQNIALMLYTMGHVLHLNQDLSQPDHVRNDSKFAGPEWRESSQQKAHRILAEELARRRWTLQDLQRLRKADPQKLEIAKRLRAETIMTYRWIAQHLSMGAPGYLSNCLRTAKG